MHTSELVDTIDARMLGPLRLTVGARSAVPSATKPRSLLALFALNPHRQLSTGSLITELWEECPPRRAATTLQTYVLQLRRLLAEASGMESPEVAARLLRTVNSGYVFTPDDLYVDIHGFHQLADRAEMSDRAGRTAEAATLYRTAEKLCAGSPLIDVQHGPMLRAEVVRLEHSLLCVTERRIAMELRLGYHRAILGELASLTAQHPFHEDFHAQFMVALYRSGNRTGALEVFQRIRGAMVGEFGLEPSRKLQELQYSIMNDDGALDLPIAS
ncbi:hypothetical protein GPX89_29260 [Nocardia sp. ET3-3]|uniref:OmpR/PhoB-type domain-containing protein n=1 Tax=Nocardia terrae TaxID=2675851 RepID=A0A7K1V5F2_9NOCA|nr:AfsR/SARP family transcriptional regulator [Nocardia terrae]MVU81318.1 hypothetical protein [Nocardia terrae]